MKKAIYQLNKESQEIIQEWSSAVDVEKELGYNSRRISQVCKGKAVSSNGFKWCYVNEKEREKYSQKEPSERISYQIIFDVDLANNFSIKKAYSSFREISKDIQQDEGFIRINCFRNNLPVSKLSNFCYIKNHVFIKKEHYKEAKKIFDEAEKFICQVPNCNQLYFSKRALATHLQLEHNLTSEQYTVKHLYGGNYPICPACGERTRYVSFSFKEYCKKHANMAMKKGGKVGGKSEAWNKGKTKKDDKRLMQQSILSRGSRNPFYGKQHTDETKKSISQQKLITEEEYNNRINSRKNEFEVLTPYEEYTSRQRQKLEMRCVKCGRKTKRTLSSFEKGCLCKKCHPFTVSRAELEIGDYIENVLGFKIERNSRSVIPPKELDIFVPERKFAIEFNGLYWHGDGREENKKLFDKRAHLKKTIECQEKGITLMHIFSDEWREQEELMKSMISARLSSKNISKIFARKCSIRELSTEEAKIFFEQSHISGHVRAIKSWGLIYEDEIVCAISVRKAFHKKYDNYIEIARFASKPFCIVTGGYSKLIKKVEEMAKLEGFGGILSYCDRRFGEGNVYVQSGYELLKSSDISYWYTDGQERFNRFKFKAQKNKPEKIVAEENGVFKVFGCGNNVYVKKF